MTKPIKTIHGKVKIRLPKKANESEILAKIAPVKRKNGSFVITEFYLEDVSNAKILWVAALVCSGTGTCAYDMVRGIWQGIKQYGIKFNDVERAARDIKVCLAPPQRHQLGTPRKGVKHIKRTDDDSNRPRI